MLSHSPFYHAHLKKFTATFGTLFNDIVIERKTTTGTTQKTIKVPLAFVNKDKALERLRSNPDLNNTWGATLPRMAFEMGTITYAPIRKTNSVNLTRKDPVTGLKSQTQFSAAPYDIQFKLSIWSLYFEDAIQIVEQILPFFQPEYVVKVNEVPALEIERDIHVVLNSITYSDNVIGEYDAERIIEWELEFTLQGYFYGPVTDRAIIKESTATSYFEPDFSGYYSALTYTVSPRDAMSDTAGVKIVETRSEGTK